MVNVRGSEVVNVKQGAYMQLIVPLRYAVVADKAGRAGVAGHVDSGAITGQNAVALIAVILLPVCAGKNRRYLYIYD